MDKQDFIQMCDEIVASIAKLNLLMQDIYALRYQRAAERAPQDVEEHMMDAVVSADDMVEHFKAAKQLLEQRL